MQIEAYKEFESKKGQKLENRIKYLEEKVLEYQFAFQMKKPSYE